MGQSVMGGEGYPNNNLTPKVDWRILLGVFAILFVSCGQSNGEIQEVMSKWRTVRDNYVRNLKKIEECGRSGSGAKRMRSYIFAQQLSFLKKNFVPRQTVSSIDPTPSCSHDPVATPPTMNLSIDTEASEGHSEDLFEGAEDLGHGAEAVVEGAEAVVEGAEAVVEGAEAVVEGAEAVVQGAEAVVQGAAAAAPRAGSRRQRGTTLEHAILRFMEVQMPPGQGNREEDEHASFLTSLLPLVRRMTQNQFFSFRVDTLNYIYRVLNPQLPPLFYPAGNQQQPPIPYAVGHHQPPIPYAAGHQQPPIPYAAGHQQPPIPYAAGHQQPPPVPYDEDVVEYRDL